MSAGRTFAVRPTRQAFRPSWVFIGVVAVFVASGAMAWTQTDDGELPYAVHGFLRSRANTIEGGTTEVNKNIIGERVLGLPREPDPWHDKPWREVPRS